MRKYIAFAALLSLLPAAYGNGVDEYPTICAKQVDYYNNVQITVTDVAQKRDVIYVVIRFPTYDGEKESYFLDAGKKIELKRKDKTTFETLYHSKHEGVHGTTARVEYVFNHNSKHHNDHTRSVVTEVTFAYH